MRAMLRATAALLSCVVVTAGSFNVLPLGDSITFGCGSDASPPNWQPVCATDAGGYRAPLYLSLLPGWQPGVMNFVGTESNGPDWVPAAQRAHEGHPGWTIPQILGIVPKFAALKPDYILLLIGTNDVAQNHTLDEMTQDLNVLLNATYAALPSSHLLLASIIGMPRTPQWIAAQSAYNAALPGIAAAWSARGFNVTYVDMANRTGICTVAGVDCTAGRVHPSAGGYNAMAAVWYDYLVPLLPLP